MELNKRVIVDTDFISYYLKGDMMTKQQVENMLTEGYLFTTTAITSAELLFGAYRKAWKHQKIKILKTFLEKIGVIAFNYNHSQIYGKLRSTMIKRGKEIGFAGTAIASICIGEKLPLFTYNIKQFQGIGQLELFDN